MIRAFTPTSGQFFPPGVTLQAIDGGNSYYADNGFTNAVAAGWDNPDKIPIGLWVPPMHAQADANRWIDLGLNSFWAVTANSNLALMRSNGFHGIAYGTGADATELLAGNGGAYGTETAGLLTIDEPDNHAEFYGAMETCANTHQDNRFWYVNMTWAWLAFGDTSGVPAATALSQLHNTPGTPPAPQRHMNEQSDDIYWFAGGVGVGAYNGAQVYGLGSMTTDENNRACHYGDTIDMLRAYQAGNFPAPLSVFIENGGPYTENNNVTNYIQPLEMNAAVWSTLIHGARYIQFFNHTFDPTPGFASDDNLSEARFDTLWPGQSISIYDQTKLTTALVQSLASVINSPKALSYGSVSPAPSSISDFHGFDARFIFQNRGSAPLGGPANCFWIIAMPRWSKTISNQTATFTIANSGASKVTVVNDGNRQIALTNGGTRFTDVFPTANTVYIYRVDT